MGKSGNPARRAAEATPLAVQTKKVMNDASKLFEQVLFSDLPHDIKVHANAAVYALMAMYAYQTGQPPPWDLPGWDGPKPEE